MKPPRKQYRLAKRVRKAAEQCQEESSSKTLVGMCGIASTALLSIFRANGFPTTYVDGMYGRSSKFFVSRHHHSWVESGGYIWDVTATQFGRKEKVLVVRKDRARAYHVVTSRTRISLCSTSRQIVKLARA